LGGAERVSGSGQDRDLLRPAAVARHPALEVLVERLARLDGAVPGEDRVGGAGAELAARVGVAGLDEHRVALRRRRQREAARERELRALELHRLAVGEPQRLGRVEDLLRPLVALLGLEDAAAAVVLTGER